MKKEKNTKKAKKIIILAIVVIGIIILGISISMRKNKTTNTEQTIEADKINFKIKDVECSKGEEINIEVELLNNSEFVAANFEYEYDSSSLEYISYEIGDSLKDGAMTIVNNDQNNEKVLIGFVAKPDGEKKIKSGKVIDIKFRVKDDLTLKNIKNKFECTTLKKEDGTDINFNIHQGKIQVK